MVDPGPSNQSNPVFVEQYAMDVVGFSSQYGSDNSISYTADNITGKPSKFPEYGDFPQAFVMRTYGKWWSEAPSRLCPIMSQSVGTYETQDYIDVEFEEAVYPRQVNIYETYNPGSVVKIWAADSEENWALLWKGEPQHIGQTPRQFSPAINSVNFKTRVLRLEFYHGHLFYYAELDAVLLIGTKSPLLMTRKVGSECILIGNLRSQIFNLNMHQIPTAVNITCTIQYFFGQQYPQYLSQSQNASTSPHGVLQPRKGFHSLPDETILEILGFLDLLSLCRCAQVSRHFHDLATDALLYVELNLKAYWNCITPTALECLKPRCKYLQKLDISWCGSMQVIKPHHFISFIVQCGTQLTHLRVNCCNFIDNECLQVIATNCKNLKEICLGNCTNISDAGFQALSTVKTLQYINMYRAVIEGSTLLSILKECRRLKHLNIGACIHINNMDEVTSTLAAFNPEIVSVDFWKTVSLTPTGVSCLSYLRNLEEIDLGWCLGFGSPADSLLALAHGCPRLKKLFLAAVRGLTDRELEPFIEHCPWLEQIDLLGSRGISPDICERILRECEHIKLLDVSFCYQISESQVEIWRNQYPNISIAQSYLGPNESTDPDQHD